MPKWDCLFLDEICFVCKYFHNPVESATQPECPRKLKPQWRRIG